MGKIKQWNIYTAANKMYYVLSNGTIAVLVFFLYKFMTVNPVCRTFLIQKCKDQLTHL